MEILAHHLVSRKGISCHLVSYFFQVVDRVLSMESKLSLINRALGAEVRAEMAAQGLTAKDVSAASGITLGQMNRIISKNDNLVRDINITQISEIAYALDSTPQMLVERAVRRAGGISAIWADRERMRAAMSVVPVTNDELAERRRKQAEAAAMSVEELEDVKGAATRDAELDSDEPELP
jgi:transcriptional regulator with XRE-family HTH domain